VISSYSSFGIFVAEATNGRENIIQKGRKQEEDSKRSFSFPDGLTEIGEENNSTFASVNGLL
jgi:hypothetical protein